jgi:hypothetical protein
MRCSLKLTANGLHLSTPGLTRSSTTLLKLSRTTLQTIKPFILSLKLPIISPQETWILLKKNFWANILEAAVLRVQTSKKFSTLLALFLGKDMIWPLYLPFVIGEKEEALLQAVTPRTTSPGTRTNTFLNTVVLAGLRDHPLQLLIDSTFTTIQQTRLPLVSMLRC